MKYTIKDLQIFIPTFNRPEYLRQSLESLVTQSAGCPDITVYNNGTLKETSDVIKEFEKYGVKEYKSKGGLLECMNSVQEYVDSPYIMFFHDDDILNSKYLEYALKALNTYENISFITSKYNEFTDFNSIDFGPAAEEHYFFTSKKQFATNMYLFEKIAMQPAIYKTELFKKFPRESNKYGKFFDWPYLVTFAGLGNSILFSDEKMFNVRRHAAQWTFDEKSSWTVDQLSNWHKQFFQAMDANTIDSEGYFIFYSKFNCFFAGGYTGLICDKYKQQCHLPEALQYAIDKIGIDKDDIIYGRIDLIQPLMNITREINHCINFGDTKTHDPINISKLLLCAKLEAFNQESSINTKTQKNVIKNIIQNIFSVKNTEDKKHKKITFLGAKIKIKRKPKNS